MDFDFTTVIDRRGTACAKWSRFAPDVLPMWVADMDFAAAPAIIAALHRRLEHPVLGYGVASEALREQVVAMLQAEYGWQVSPDTLLFLPGVVPGFNMALKAFCAPGDGVLVQTPVYPPMLAAPGHWGLRRVDAPLRREAAGFAVDQPAFRAAIAQCRAFLLCNPHNPLGKVFTRGELAAMAEACLAADAVIIADEIHAGLQFDGRAHVPIASLDPAIAARSITLMSASKAFNIAGLAAAFAIIPDAALRARFAAAHMGMVGSVNALGLEATRAAYAQAGPWLAALLPVLQANRDALLHAVATRLPGLACHVPEGTFLAWLDATALPVADPHAFLRDVARVGCSPGPDFGEAGRGHVRLNFGCPPALLEDGIARIQAALATL
jgi:cystathionine beta-lyase